MELEKLIGYFEAAAPSYDEWKEARRGKITASPVFKIITGINTDGAQTYLDGLIGESIGVVDEYEYQSPAMINGATEELPAMQLYMLDAKGTIYYGSKIFIPLGENAGVSPDGIEILDGKRIYLEVKCPSAPNKLSRLLRTKNLKKDRKDIYWQCVMNMLVLDCDAAKVLVYHPRTGLSIIEVERNEADIELCEKAIALAVEYKLKETILLKEKLGL
jgi:hypothetical protein